VKPFLHNHPKTKVQIKAKISLAKTPRTETPLNNIIMDAITAITKYILAGVQS